VLARGRPVGDEICEVPSFDLIGGLDPAHNAFDIEIRLAEDCRLVVNEASLKGGRSAINVARLLNVPVALAAATEYRIFGEYALHDFIHLDLTAAKAWLDYYDDGSQVYGGHNDFVGCDSFPLTGWYTYACGQSGKNLNGPSEVWNETHGSFGNVFQPGLAHDLWARPVGNPGGGAWILCQRSGAGAPVGTHWHCSGYQTPL
jgi:hypothetical protein